MPACPSDSEQYEDEICVRFRLLPHSKILTINYFLHNQSTSSRINKCNVIVERSLSRLAIHRISGSGAPFSWTTAAAAAVSLLAASLSLTVCGKNVFQINKVIAE